jgi:hypothetical protein
LTPIKCTYPYDPSKVIIFISYPIVLLIRNMYEHKQRRAVAKKRKYVVNVYSEKGGNKQSMNICREVKAPPREQAPKPTDDEVLPLKIHSPLEESDSLRESVNYRKQDHNTITTQRDITCYDIEKQAYESKKKFVVNMQWID